MIVLSVSVLLGRISSASLNVTFGDVSISSFVTSSTVISTSGDCGYDVGVCVFLGFYTVSFLWEGRFVGDWVRESSSAPCVVSDCGLSGCCSSMKSDRRS